jgi:hypothetical protein
MVEYNAMSLEESDDQLFAEVEAEVGAAAAESDDEMAALEADLASLMAEEAELDRADAAAAAPLVAERSPETNESTFTFNGAEVTREDKWVRKDGKFQKITLAEQLEQDLERQVEEEQRALQSAAEPRALGSAYEFNGAEVKTAQLHVAASKQVSSEEDSEDEEIRALKAEVAALEMEVGVGDEQANQSDTEAMAKIVEDLARLELHERDVERTNSAQARNATDEIVSKAAREAVRVLSEESTSDGTVPEEEVVPPLDDSGQVSPTGSLPAVDENEEEEDDDDEEEDATALPARRASPAGPPSTVAAPVPSALSAAALSLSPPAQEPPVLVETIAPWMREMMQCVQPYPTSQEFFPLACWACLSSCALVLPFLRVDVGVAVTCRLEQSIAAERNSQTQQTAAAAAVTPPRQPKQMKKMTPTSTPTPAPQPEPEPAVLEPVRAVERAEQPLVPAAIPEDKYAHLAGTNPFDTPPIKQPTETANTNSSRLAAAGGPLSSPLSLVLAPEQQQLRKTSASQLVEMSEDLAAASGWVGVSYPARNADVVFDGIAQTGFVAITATCIQMSLRHGYAAAAQGKDSLATKAKKFLREREIQWKDVRSWHALPGGAGGSGPAQVLVNLAGGVTLMITPLGSAVDMAPGSSDHEGSQQPTERDSWADATRMAKEMAVASAQASRYYTETKRERQQQEAGTNMGQSVDWEDVSVVSADLSTPTGSGYEGIDRELQAEQRLEGEGQFEEAEPPVAAAAEAVTLAEAVPLPEAANGNSEALRQPQPQGQARELDVAPQFYRSLTILAEFEGHVQSLIRVAAEHGGVGGGQLPQPQHTDISSFVSTAKTAAAELRSYQSDLLGLAGLTPSHRAAPLPSKLLGLVGQAEQVRADLARAKASDLEQRRRQQQQHHQV